MYKALTEIGKAVKTQFLCHYLEEEALRIEIHEALNMVERLNGAMNFIFYGNLGEITSNKMHDQELTVVCLHLLQVCMMYINTLIIQEILAEPQWKDVLTAEDLRALSPLIYGPLSDYFGRRKVLILGMFIFFIGNILCATMLLVSRLIAGIGAGSCGVLNRGSMTF